MLRSSMHYSKLLVQAWIDKNSIPIWHLVTNLCGAHWKTLPYRNHPTMPEEYKWFICVVTEYTYIKALLDVIENFILHLLYKSFTVFIIKITFVSDILHFEVWDSFCRYIALMSFLVSVLFFRSILPVQILLKREIQIHF